MKSRSLYHVLLSINLFVCLFDRGHIHDTRNKSELNPSFAHSTLTLHSLSFRAINFWNQLPDEIKQCNSISSVPSKRRRTQVLCRLQFKAEVSCVTNQLVLNSPKMPSALPTSVQPEDKQHTLLGSVLLIRQIYMIILLSLILTTTLFSPLIKKKQKF